MFGLRATLAAIGLSSLLCGPAAGDDTPTPAQGLRLGGEAVEQLRSAEEENGRLDGFRQPAFRQEANGTATGVVYRTEDVYVGRLKRSTSPFHAAATHWVFDDGVYVRRNGDRYAGRFHFFHENWGEDFNASQESWLMPFTGRYILVGSFIPMGGAPQVGIFGAEIFGDQPISFAPADQAYLAQFEQRYNSQVAAFKHAQIEAAESGLSFGQILALGLGGMALVAADVPAPQAIEIGGALATDVLGGGRTNALGAVVAAQQAGLNNAAANDPAANTPPTGAGGQAGYTSEEVAISCPSGVSSIVPISYRTQQCRAAMIDFAQVYSCNAIDDFARVSQGCRSACGNAQCRE